MADYIYAMETRLTPEQQRGVALVQEVARAHEMNVYLTGGAIRDLITGLPIRDLDFTVQGNALKLQKDLEKAGATVQGVAEELKSLHLTLPGNVRAEVSMARSETYEKAGKGPAISPATINEDLRRRDFSVNAMALSLNPGSRGLLLDPANGAADIEAKLIRILHNYSFYEDPSRLIRAIRFSTRFHWPLEERTQVRYDTAKESNYIDYVSERALGVEIEQLAYEDDPVNLLKALEKEGWLKVLNEHWSTAKIDSAALTQVMKLRQQMQDLGYAPDTSAMVLYFLTRRLSEKEVADIRKKIPRKDLVETWKNLESDARELAKTLSGKEAATPSGAWQVLTKARPDLVLFLALTSKQQAIKHKIDNLLGKWPQLKSKLPFPEMAEMRITPLLPDYPKIAQEAFLLLLDGKLRSHGEIVKFLKPYEPPLPPPPPPPRRGRAKAAVAAAAPTPTAEAVAAVPKKGKGKGKAAAAAPVSPAPPQPAAAPAKGSAKPPAAPKAAAGKPAQAPGKTAPQKTAKAAAKPPTKVQQKAPAKPPAEAQEKATPKPAEKKAQPAAKPAAKKSAPQPQKKKSGTENRPGE